MIAELYASLCGTELWNRERLSAYVKAGISPPGLKLHCQACTGMSDLIPCVENRPPEPGGYVLPELDNAPWYDPAAPESMNFAGFLVLETILSPAIDRRLVQNVGHGATLTRARYQGRTLYVRGALVGKTCCAVEYGMRWMTQAMLGNQCHTCEGCTLTFLTCCPSEASGSECLTVIEGDSYVPYYRAADDDEWLRGLDFARYMCGANLLKAPEIIACHGVGGCGCNCSNVTEIEFTIGIGSPWMNRFPVAVATNTILAGCDISEDCLEFSAEPDCDRLGYCPDPDDCGDDPNCTEIVKPPKGSIPDTDCGCLPFITGRNCFNVAADREWFDQTIVLELYAGSSAMRNIAIRAWPNPLNLDCCDPLYAAAFPDCDACATLFINYLPAYGTLNFDSACREVTITCNGITKPAFSNISSIEDMAFDWFDVGCQGACIAIDVDCVNMSEDATVTIQRVGREL